MPLIAYSEFVSRMLKNVFPDTDNDGDESHLEPHNLRFPHRTYVQNALIKVQTMVECLRQNNVNTFTLDDATVNCGVAVFFPPEHIRPAAVYAYKPAKGCTRVHYEQKSVGAVMCYVDQFASCKCAEENDICNAVRTGDAVCDNLALCDDWDEEVGEPDTPWLCEEKFFAVGAGSKIYTAPRMPCGYRLAVHWEGIKYRYADDDLISDDPDLLDVVSTYVQAERARTFDRDLALHRELLGKGPPVNGREGSVFHVKLIDVAYRCKEERRVRKRECLEMWDDSALEAQLDPVPARDEAGIEFEQCDGCPEGQVMVDGECVDCLTPMVSITASESVLEPGGTVTVTWNSSNVIDHALSKVFLEYGTTSVPLEPNEGGTLEFTPEEATTYTIRAETPCGADVTAAVSVTVLVEDEEECECPEAVPECLQVAGYDPDEIFFQDCAVSAGQDAEGEVVWDGTLPYLGECRWGFEFPNDKFYRAGPEGDPNFSTISVIVEQVSCDPYTYRLTFYVLREDEPEAIWEGETAGTPLGIYTSLHAGDVVEWGCAQTQSITLENCVPCTEPTVRFDPPAESVVSFPTLVFIHASIAGSAIYYGINGNPNTLYTGPITLTEGQELSARAISPDLCEGPTVEAEYETDTGLVFQFICDGPNDESGVFGYFAPNYETDDYHWRITATRAGAWTLNSAKIYEADADGVWVTGQAWATENPIYPIEMDPDPFAVYPLVLFDAYTQINTDYGDPVDTFGAGVTTLEGYGQPYVPLVGYFRLEFRITEGVDTFTIYKLISHECECPEAPDVSLEANCDGSIALTIAGLEVGSNYRIYRAELPPCGSGTFTLLHAFTADDDTLEYADEGTNGCSYSYFISVFCQTWINGAVSTVSVPAPCDVPTAFCNPASITIPPMGRASPYPATVTVAGRPGNVTKATVGIFGYSHRFPDDVEILLVGPDGTKVLLMNDCGGDGPFGILAPGVNIMFDDAAGASLQDNGPRITSGTYKPTSYGMTFFESPAPPGPYDTTLAAFIGKPCNGIWKLYVLDDHGQDAGAIAGGWCLYLD